jgi:hypothetical protein
MICSITKEHLADAIICSYDNICFSLRFFKQRILSSSNLPDRAPPACPQNGIFTGGPPGGASAGFGEHSTRPPSGFYPKTEQNHSSNRYNCPVK